MDKPMQEKIRVNSEPLHEVLLYLTGLKDGKGNLLPMGTIVLDELQNTIKYLQGDKRYYAKRDEHLK